MTKKVLLFALSILWAAAAQAKGGINIYDYPREVPKIGLYHPSGQEVYLRDFKGDFVLVMFWSRYCAPCIRELDEVNEFVKKTRDNGIRLILVSPQNEWKSISEQRTLLKKYGAPDVEFYLDTKGALAAAFGIFSSPHTVLINRVGEEIGRIRGTAEWDDDDLIEYIYKIKAENG